MAANNPDYIPPLNRDQKFEFVAHDGELIEFIGKRRNGNLLFEISGVSFDDNTLWETTPLGEPLLVWLPDPWEAVRDADDGFLDGWRIVNG